MTTVFGSTHVVEQLSFSLFLSILTFDFDSILGSFLTFWGNFGVFFFTFGGPNGLFLGLGSTQLAEQLSFSMFPSFLTFDFDLILGTFLTFVGPNGLFLGLEKGSNTVLGSTHVVEQLSFSLFLSNLTFDFDLILG